MNPSETQITYHPDSEINEEVSREVIEAERIDTKAGFRPRKWQCPGCKQSHSRGFFGVIGNHRCLKCGYAGDGGVLLEP